MFLFCLVISLLISLPEACKTQNGYERVIFQSKDVSGNATNTVSAILDPGQQRIKRFGNLYNDMTANQITIKAFEFFMFQYGLNFSAGIVSPIGSYSLIDTASSSYPYPYATMFPYANGDDYLQRLVYDSDHPKRGKSGEWFVFSAGYLVLMNATGTFKGGVRFNTSYVVGDVMGHNYYNYLNQNEKPKWNNVNRFGEYTDREIILTRSEIVTKQVVNGQGFTEQHVKETIVDDRGNLGLNIGGTFVEKLPNGQIVQNSRNVLTFPGMISFKLPKA